MDVQFTEHILLLKHSEVKVKNAKYNHHVDLIQK